MCVSSPLIAQYVIAKVVFQWPDELVLLLCPWYTCTVVACTRDILQYRIVGNICRVNFAVGLPCQKFAVVRLPILRL